MSYKSVRRRNSRQSVNTIKLILQLNHVVVWKSGNILRENVLSIPVFNSDLIINELFILILTKLYFPQLHSLSGEAKVRDD